jgi:hypothetical protein
MEAERELNIQLAFIYLNIQLAFRFRSAAVRVHEQPESQLNGNIFSHFVQLPFIQFSLTQAASRRRESERQLNGRFSVVCRSFS